MGFGPSLQRTAVQRAHWATGVTSSMRGAPPLSMPVLP